MGASQQESPARRRPAGRRCRCRRAPAARSGPGSGPPGHRLPPAARTRPRPPPCCTYTCGAGRQETTTQPPLTRAEGKTGKARRARQDGQGKTGKARRARRHGQGNTGKATRAPCPQPLASVRRVRGSGTRRSVWCASRRVAAQAACRTERQGNTGAQRQPGAARRGKATCALARSRGAWAGRRAAARGGPPAPGPAPAGTSTLQQDTATHHRPIVSRRPRPAPLLPPDVPRGTRGAVEHRRACARAARHGALLSRAAAHTGIKCDGDEAAADDADVDDVGLLRPRRPRL